MRKSLPSRFVAKHRRFVALGPKYSEGSAKQEVHQVKKDMISSTNTNSWLLVGRSIFHTIAVSAVQLTDPCHPRTILHSGNVKQRQQTYSQKKSAEESEFPSVRSFACLNEAPRSIKNARETTEDLVGHH